MQEPQRARIKRTLDHMAEHDGNIKYDKYTGEIHYDGVKAPDSDVRELLSTLTSKKKRITAPKGWDLFMRSLKDTDAVEGNLVVTYLMMLLALDHRLPGQMMLKAV